MNSHLQRKISVVSFLIAVLGGTPVFAQDSRADNARARLVERELSCIAKVKSPEGAFTWADVCSLEETSSPAAPLKSVNVVVDVSGEVTVGTKPVPKAVIPASPQKSSGEDVRAGRSEPAALISVDSDLEKDWAPVSTRLAGKPEPDFSVSSAVDRDRKKKSFEFGSENFYYDFDSDDGNSRYGTLFGVFAAFTYRPGPEEDLARDDKITMVKLDGHLAQDIDAFMFDGRGLAGYDFIFGHNSRVTPYMGIGYRYFRDKDAGHTQVFEDTYGTPLIYANGASPVKEEFKYIYIPVGFELYRPVRARWAVQLTCEFDYILQGRATRYYNDLGQVIFDGESGHVPNAMEFDHDRGYGWRMALKFLRSAPDVDLFLEPFVRFWRLRDSDEEQLGSDGNTIWFHDEELTDPIGTRIRGHKITEYGLKAGVLF